MIPTYIDHHASRRRGITIVECLTATVITALMISAALEALRVTTLQKQEADDQRVALLLAQQLMTEIQAAYYEDPQTSPVFGPESGEAGSGREAFDDTDDYHGYSDAPPMDRTGTAYTGLSDWSRSVSVRWASSTNYDSDVGAETGYKRIEVNVSRSGRLIRTLTAIRSKAIP